MTIEELLYTAEREGFQKGYQKGFREGRLEERRKIEEVLRKEGINEKTISEILAKLAQKGKFVKATCK